MKSAADTSRSNELWTFFRQWLRRPLSMASVTPSSRYLAKRIVAALPPDTRRVVELGPGTGIFTRALLDHGIAKTDLLAIEFNPTLHAYLTEHFPGVQFVHGDAREIDRLADVNDFLKRGPAQAVVSGLGILSMSRDTQHAILDNVFALMAPGGVFIQFTYGPAAPVSAEVMADMKLTAVRRSFTLLNVPPASVYTFTRQA